MDELEQQRDDARAEVLNRVFEARQALLAYMALDPDDTAAHATFSDLNMAVIHLRWSGKAKSQGPTTGGQDEQP